MIRVYGQTLNKTSLTLTELLIISYEFLFSAALILFPTERVDSTYHLTINAAVVVGILLLGRMDKTSGALQFIRTFYPLALTGFLYIQACEVRFLFSPVEFDSVLLRWEHQLFGREWYRIFSQLPVWVLELFHGLYFSYYIALFLFAALAWKTKPELVKMYVFTFTLSSLLHYVVIIGFPAAGPVPLRKELLPDGFLFIPIMNWIYANADQGGGAFPSLHVASTIILAKFAVRFNPEHRVYVLLLALGIILSTVVGSFHYAVDALAGIITGWLAYHLGNWLFLQLHYEKT